MGEPPLGTPIEMTPERADLLAVTMAWADRWFDPDRAMLWNPPGSLTPEVEDLSVHQLPQSAWYALGLLQRRGPSDVERAIAVLHAVCDLQYDTPGTEWHGTFAQFAESATPGADAVMWFDFDPNWRQFLGTTLVLILRSFEHVLPAELVARLERALRLTVEGEHDRVRPWYSNIALMKAVLDVEVGSRLGEPRWVAEGLASAEEIAARYAGIGGLDEFNSPTYYGVDLLGLAMWRSCPDSGEMRVLGARIEAGVWNDIADFFHAGLGNLCGPFTRTYGMDMHRYVAGLSVWIWAACGRDRAPLPPLDGASVAHGHDLLKGPVAAMLGAMVPPTARAALTTFPGERRIERILGGSRPRSITAWMAEDLMVGAEAASVPSHATFQFCPVTVHWRLPDGGVGSLRLRHDGPVRAAAEVGALVIEVDPNPAHGATDTTFRLSPAMTLGSGRPLVWDLPGLQISLAVTSESGEPVQARSVSVVRGPEETRVSFDGAAARRVYRLDFRDAPIR